MPSMLIAEDNQDVSDILREYAIKDGFTVFVAKDGQEALDLTHVRQFDILLLDVTMPKIDGYSVCQQIRKSSLVPIIMITARSEEFERIKGLKLGADDYIVKPFSMAETMARIQAVLRRAHSSSREIVDHNSFVFDNLRISLNDYSVFIDSTRIDLSRKEVELIWILATNQNKVFTRERLIDNIWGNNFKGYDRNIDVRMKRLRDKLDKVAHPNWRIKTIWGVGYQFDKVASGNV